MTVDRLRLAKMFAYNAASRSEIVRLLQPLALSSFKAAQAGRAADDICINSVEAAARTVLGNYVECPRATAAVRKRHYQKVSSAAYELLKLIEDRASLSGWSAGYQIWDYGKPNVAAPDYNFLPLFEGGLRALAERTAKIATTGEPEDPAHVERFGDAQDPEKVDFAMTLLMIYVQEVDRKPGRSSTGPAARFLVAAMDPVMEFARHRLAVEYASPINGGENARYLIGRVLDQESLGENTPVFRTNLSPTTP